MNQIQIYLKRNLSLIKKGSYPYSAAFQRTVPLLSDLCNQTNRLFPVLLHTLSGWSLYVRPLPHTYLLLSVTSVFSWYNVIRYLLHCVCCRNLRVISHFCHFCKNRMTNFLYSRFYSSHSFSSRASIDSPDTLLTCIIRICNSA